MAFNKLKEIPGVKVDLMEQQYLMLEVCLLVLVVA